MAGTRPSHRIIGFLDYHVVNATWTAAAAYDVAELSRLRRELRKDLETLRGLGILLRRLERDARRAEASPTPGSVEWKLVNGKGPYAYLRQWAGGQHRSSYLGKEPHRKLQELGYTSQEIERLLAPKKPAASPERGSDSRMKEGVE